MVGRPPAKVRQPTNAAAAAAPVPRGRGRGARAVQQPCATLRAASAPGAATSARGRGGRSRGGTRGGRARHIRVDGDASAVTVIEEEDETSTPPHECDSGEATGGSDELAKHSLSRQRKAQHSAPRLSRTRYEVETNVDENSVGPASTPSLTPSASAAAGSRCAASDDVVSVVSHSPTPVRQAREVEDNQREEEEEEEDVVQPQKCRTFRHAAHAGPLCEVAPLQSEDDDEEGEEAAPQAVRPSPARTMSNGSACFTRGSAHGAGAAPLLHASGLVEYFTYGVQATLRHHAAHLRCAWDDEAPAPAGPADSAEPRMAGNGAAAASAPPLYGNAFLSETSIKPRGTVTLALHGATSRRRSTDRDSSGATYDSDAESGPDKAPPAPPPEEKQQPREVSTNPSPAASASLLDPARTSLYRAASAVPHRNAAPCGAAAADSSWLSAGAAAPAVGGVRGAHRDVEATQETSVTELVREALRSSYAAEDAQRHRRRAELDLQQAQLVRGLALLQGGWSAASSALLSELLPTSRVPSNRASSTSGHGLRAAAPAALPSRGHPSPLSLLATCAESIAALNGGAAATTAAPRGAQSRRCNIDDMYAVDGGSDEAGARQGVEVHGAPPPPRVLQVMSPSAAERLHRPPNPFVDAVLRHLQDSVQRQRAARLREDQATRARRMYELPVLTEDVVRYAALLCCLRRRSASPAPRHNHSPSRLLPGSPPSSPLHPLPTPGTPTTVPGAALTPFGEEGTLLYLKYPAPLLRTTSFAVETVRLLRWLRTWRKKSGLAATAATAGGEVRRRNPQRKRARGEAVAGARGGQRHRPPPKSHRRRHRAAVLSVEDVASNSDSNENDGGSDVEVADAERRSTARPAPHVLPCAPVAHVVKSEAGVVAAGASAPRRHTSVDALIQHAREAQVAQAAQVKEEKRSAFMRFFGAAAAAAASPSVKAEEGTGSSNSSSSGSNSSKDAAVVVARTRDDAAEEVVVKPPETLLATREPPHTEQRMNSTDLVFSDAAATATPAISTQGPLPFTQAEPSQSVSASRAYQLYRLAWRHAVKTGITPLAVAASAFAAAPCGFSDSDVWTSMRAVPSGGDTDAAAGASSWTNGRVSKVCAALPFFKEMREEARRTALGSAANGTYYEDAYGNRLRSARLAKKEQEQRAQLAARQRRRAKKKGYFHRGGAEEAGGVGGGGGVGGATAMLEAMLRTGTGAAPCSDARATRRRRHTPAKSDTTTTTNSSSSSSSEDDDEAAQSTTSDDSTGSEGARGPQRRRGQRGRPRTSAARFDSSASTSPAESDSDDDADTKDELTNIAVVSGPTGAGKTAAVYVAAQLLGFRVVEMNASVRRCSKSVEHLLAELTRSHRLSGLTRPGTAGGGATVEEELARLKQQHAALLARAKAEAAAAEREAESKRREARKANGISAQAVASFFAKGSSGGKAALKAGSRPGQAAAVTVVDEPLPPTGATADATANSPSPPPPLPPPPAAPTTAPSSDTQTLLLFEDADVLLGDESAKPFYAAIRDLAHRSKVPIVVTVSADPAPSQRYDTEPFLTLAHECAHHQPQPQPRQTYWQLCESAGLTTPMAALEAAQQALQGETELSSRGGAPSGAATGGGGGHDGSGGAAASSSPATAGAESGGSAGTSPPAASGSAAALHSLFSPPTHSSAGGGAGASTGTGTGGALSSAAAASLAARYTHVVLNASLVSHFFGAQTPFTVVDALPPAALFAQLLAVGAVELDLLDGAPPLAGEQEARGGESAATWQQELDEMARRLRVRDVALFTELAVQLRRQIFGGGGAEAAVSVPSADVHAAEGAAQLGVAVHGDAVRRTTTDIRFWLNRLQVLLLSLRSGGREWTEQHPARKRPREEAVLGTPRPRVGLRGRAMGDGDDEGADTDDITCDYTASRHRAERLVEAEFQSRVSLASSAWDVALGRHLSNVSHNELHGARYTHWLLDTHVLYGPDVLEELATVHHPTARIPYAAPPAPVASTAAPATAPRRGRPPSSAAGRKAATAAIAPSVGASHGTAGGDAGAAAAVVVGGMNAAWRSFFSTPAASSPATRTLPASPSTTPPASSPSTVGTPGDPRQQTLFGYSRPTSPTSHLHPSGSGGLGLCAGGASAAAAALSARGVDWPPSIAELRRQSARSGAPHARPVELLLPYGAAARYYTAAATSASSAAALQLHAAAELTAGLLGHDVAPHLVAGPPSAGTLEAPASDFDVVDALPLRRRTSQEDRFGVFRRWWRRTRKVGALRDSVAGRSAGTLEDLVGFGALLTPSAAASLHASSGAL